MTDELARLKEELLSRKKSIAMSGQDIVNACILITFDEVDLILSLLAKLEKCQNDRAGDQQRLFHYEAALAKKPAADATGQS